LFSGLSIVEQGPLIKHRWQLFWRLDAVLLVHVLAAKIIRRLPVCLFSKHCWQTRMDTGFGHLPRWQSTNLSTETVDAATQPAALPVRCRACPQHQKALAQTAGQTGWLLSIYIKQACSPYVACASSYEYSSRVISGMSVATWLPVLWAPLGNPHG
jgi:hypothetical protein